MHGGQDERNLGVADLVLGVFSMFTDVAISVVHGDPGRSNIRISNDGTVGLLDFDESRGALQLDYTFPLHRRFRGYIQFFDGYGDSLIDYNADIERVGIGILLSDLL